MPSSLTSLPCTFILFVYISQRLHLSSSQIDTTAVQTLIDTRVEVERWADQPIEFHFATILSPWIRRALIAGGFGTGSSSTSFPREIAPVVSYRHELKERRPHHVSGDLESGVVEDARGAIDPSYGEVVGDSAPIVQVDTPFFHFDLATAVKAAERGLKGDRRSLGSGSDVVSVEDIKA